MLVLLILLIGLIIQLSYCSDLITTIAGTGTATYSGDNGQATSAAMSGPYGVALDSSGNHHFTSIIHDSVAT